MKQFKILGNLLKPFFLAGVMTACNHSDSINPIDSASLNVNDQNTKINAELKLINDNGIILQYIKQGKFAGKISKASGPSYTIEYAYDDTNPAGGLWITRKLYSKPNKNLIEHFTYQVSNGLCIAAEDVKHNTQYQYKYNANQLLEEVKWGGKTETYTYGYSFAANSYRLAKMTRVVMHLGKIESMDQFTITYSAIIDKYPMNPQLMPFNGIDQYLPIYGKFSDVLPGEIHKNSITPNGSILQGHRTYTYGLNGDGYVTSKTVTFLGDPSPWNFTYSYSTNWQGLPDNP